MRLHWRALGRWPSLICLAGGLVSAPALASSDPFSSDQPGFSSATKVAPKHHLITEFRLTSTPLESEPGVGFPGTSFRLGLTDWLELRWRAPELLFQRQTQPGAKSKVVINLADPVIGFKVAGNVGSKVAISTVTELSLPFGSGNAGAARTGWSVDFNLDWAVNSKLTLVPNMLMASEWTGTRERGSRRMAAALSFAGAWQFTPEVGAFTQLYSWFRRDQPGNLQFGMGLTWRVRSYAQIDASVNLPVIKGGEAAIVGIGTTWYWQGWQASRR